MRRGFAAAPNVVGRNILLSIGASFVAAGFVSWAILQAKELMMAIADWIREATERRRERIFAEAVQSEAYRQKYAEGFRQGYDEAFRQRYAEGFRQGLVEGYLMGYDDADKGNPRRPPANGINPNGSNGDNGELK